MTIRRVFAILIALAVLLAPWAAATASAAEPNHDMQMMQAGHCQIPPDHDKNAGKSCCISISIGLAASLATPFADESAPTITTVFAEPSFLLGHPGKLPTPPPKLS